MTAAPPLTTVTAIAAVMSAADFGEVPLPLAGRTLQTLLTAGTTFYLDSDGGLVLEAPAGVLTPGAKGVIASRKTAIEEYLKHEPRTPVAVRCAHLNGDVIWRAGDTCPVPPVHEGRVVYRTSELPLLRAYTPAALATLHVDKRRLLSVWKGTGWYMTRPRFDDKKRRRSGFEVTLEDIARSANMTPAAANRLVDYLCRAGIVCGWALGGDECLRLVPPEERWAKRFNRFDPAAGIDSGESTDGITDGIADFDFGE